MPGPSAACAPTPGRAFLRPPSIYARSLFSETDTEDSWEDAMSDVDGSASSASNSRKSSFNSFRDPTLIVQEDQFSSSKRGAVISLDGLEELGWGAADLLEKLDIERKSSSLPVATVSTLLPPVEQPPPIPSAVLLAEKAPTAPPASRTIPFWATELTSLDIDALLAAYDIFAWELEVEAESARQLQQQKALAAEVMARKRASTLLPTGRAGPSVRARGSVSSEETTWESFVEQELLSPPEPSRQTTRPNFSAGPVLPTPPSTFPSRGKNLPFPSRPVRGSAKPRGPNASSPTSRPAPLTFSTRGPPTTRAPLSPVMASPLSTGFPSLPPLDTTELVQYSSLRSPRSYSPPLAGYSKASTSRNSISSASSSLHSAGQHNTFRWSSITSSTTPSSVASEDWSPKGRSTPSHPSTPTSQFDGNFPRFYEALKTEQSAATKKNNLGQLHKFVPKTTPPALETLKKRREGVNFQVIDEEESSLANQAMNEVVDWSSLFREGFYQASSSMPALGKYEDADSRPNSGDTIHGSSFLASSPRPSLDQSRARHLSKFTTTNGSVHSFGDPFSSQLSLARSDKSIKAFKGGLFHSLRNIRSRIDLKKSSPSLQ